MENIEATQKFIDQLNEDANRALVNLFGDVLPEEDMKILLEHKIKLSK